MSNTPVHILWLRKILYFTSTYTYEVTIIIRLCGDHVLIIIDIELVVPCWLQCEVSKWTITIRNCSVGGQT